MKRVETMKKDANRIYRLYALPLTGENIAVAASERFSRATPTPEPGYVLIYTDKDAPKYGVNVAGDSAKLLTPTDCRWLMDCNAAIFAEEIEKNREAVIGRLSDSIEMLETELKRRKEETETRGE